MEQVKRQHEPLHQPEIEKKVKVKVNRKRWISTGEKFLYSISSAAVLAASLFFVNFAAKTDDLNRDIRSLETEISEQETLNENLAYQVKELSNPDRILSIAKEHGLDIQYSKVKQAGTVGN